MPLEENPYDIYYRELEQLKTNSSMIKRKQENNLLFGSIALLIAAIIIVALVIIVRGFTQQNAHELLSDDFSGVTPIVPPISTGNWTLIDLEGNEFAALALNGKPTLLSFGFANCPDICPLTLREFQQVQNTLGTNSDAVNFAWISVDGNRDTPENISAKLQQLGVQDFVIGLTGDPEDVRLMGQPFGLNFVYGEPNEAGYYTVDHTSSYFLLDAQGNLVVRFAFGVDRARIVEEIEKLLP